MKLQKQIDGLWNELAAFIDSAHAGCTDAGMLGDYTTKGGGWCRDLDNLVEREAANEKKHRNFSPRGYKAPISSVVAAKLILLGNFADGSQKIIAPLASEMLIYRHTAVEMGAIGYLCRAVVTDDFRNRVRALDYAQIMKAA